MFFSNLTILFNKWIIQSAGFREYHQLRVERHLWPLTAPP